MGQKEPRFEAPTQGDPVATPHLPATAVRLNYAVQPRWRVACWEGRADTQERPAVSATGLLCRHFLRLSRYGFVASRSFSIAASLARASGSSSVSSRTLLASSLESSPSASWLRSMSCCTLTILFSSAWSWAVAPRPSAQSCVTTTLDDAEAVCFTTSTGCAAQNESASPPPTITKPWLLTFPGGLAPPKLTKGYYRRATPCHGTLPITSTVAAKTGLRSDGSEVLRLFCEPRGRWHLKSYQRV